MSDITKRLRLVPVQFPPWEEFHQQIEADLELQPGESSRFVHRPVLMQIPDAVHQDLLEAARRLSWTSGQVMSYFMMLGIRTAIERADQAETS